MFSPLHWLIVGIVALLVLGPDKLPGAARQIARPVRALQDARQMATDQVTGMLDLDEAEPVTVRPRLIGERRQSERAVPRCSLPHRSSICRRQLAQFSGYLSATVPAFSRFLTQGNWLRLATVDGISVLRSK